MDSDYLPWLRRQLAGHPQTPQSCRCMGCASAAAELRLIGEDPGVPVQTVEQVLRRAA